MKVKKFLFSGLVVVIGSLFPNLFILKLQGHILKNSFFLISFLLASLIFILSSWIISARILLERKIEINKKFFSQIKQAVFYFAVLFVFLTGFSPIFLIVFYWLILRSVDLFIIADEKVKTQAILDPLRISKTLVKTDFLYFFLINLAWVIGIYFLRSYKSFFSDLMFVSLIGLLNFFYLYFLSFGYKKSISLYEPVPDRIGKIWVFLSILGWIFSFLSVVFFANPYGF